MEMTRIEKAARIKEIVYKYGSFLFEQIDSVPITFVDNRTNTPMIGKSVSFNVINCEKPDGFYQAYEISSQHLPDSIVDRILMSAERWAFRSNVNGASVVENKTFLEKHYCATVIFGKDAVDRYVLLRDFETNGSDEEYVAENGQDFHFETQGELNAFIQGMEVAISEDEFCVVE